MDNKTTRKQERETRKQQRIEAKAKKQAELAALIQRAQEVTSRIPPEFGEWGVTKTRAFLRVQEITLRRTKLLRPPPSDITRVHFGT